MIVAPVAGVVAVATALVASQCARNMIQVVELRRKYKRNVIDCNDSNNDHPLAFLLERNSKPEMESETIPTTATATADRLRTMNREDLLRVFANSRAPTPSELSEWFSGESHGDGELPNERENENDLFEWDGVLLDNNGAIMTVVSNVMTHGLFGGIALPWRLTGASSKAKGRWKGKAFAKPTSVSNSNSSGYGINRFESSSKDIKSKTFQRHAFDYEIANSKLLPEDNNKNNLCLRVNYAKYQSLPISLWASMRDELRVVDVDADKSNVVLIGVGSMGWSGGALNCSPFLLERSVAVSRE